MLKLRVASSPAWLQAVLADFNAFLGDHASCERKASATAMAFVAHYPDRPELVEAMLELATEELEHFKQVYALLRSRDLQLGPDTKDAYVRQLRALFRKGAEPYFLDRLLVAAVVEARGCERFGLIAEALEPGPLKDFYADIARSEARHHAAFLRLAQNYFETEDVGARLSELLDREAKILADLPPRAALH